MNTNIIALIVIVVAIILFILYGFNAAVMGWLLPVAIVLAVIAVIVFLLRFITGNRTR